MSFCFRRLLVRRTSALMLLQVTIFLSSAHAVDNEGFTAITGKIERYIDANPDVRIDIAIVHQDNMVLDSAFRETSDSNDEGARSLFRIGSVTKLFTALAVMKLEDDGLIDIDQPVFAYLPRFSVKRRFSDSNPVTIRHLLTHHSGLPTNILKGQWSNDHFTTIIEQLRNEYLTYPPNFVYSYSNIGYSLLGAMIEEVSGQSYESYITENIIRPLGMKDTAFWSGTMPPPNLVTPADTKQVQGILPIRDTPAMGLYSSAKDMARFLIMLVNQGKYDGRQIAHPVILDQMMERSNEDVTLDYDHEVGIGLVLNHCSFKQTGLILEHGGQTMHYSSYFIAVPELDIAVIVLSNSRDSKGFIHEIASQLIKATLDRYHPDLNRQPEKMIAGNPDTKSDQASDIEIGKSSSYLTSSGLLTFQIDEDEKCACIKDKRFDLIPMPDGWYAISSSNDDKKLEFSPQKVNGKKVLAARKLGRAQRIGEYIPDKGIPTTWQQRLGDYQIENPDPDFPVQDVCLIEEDNMLFLSYRMPLLTNKRIDIPLTPIDDTQAITTGLGRGRGETVLMEQTNEGEYLLYSGYLAKRIENQ